jgi:hypothetical protein
MKNYGMLFLSAWIVLCPLTALRAAPSNEDISARGGGARGGGARAGGVARPGVAGRPVARGAAIQRTPSLSRAGVAAVGYRAGYNTGASSSYYPYYPTEPYYYNTTPAAAPSPYALPNYNPA